MASGSDLSAFDELVLEIESQFSGRRVEKDLLKQIIKYDDKESYLIEDHTSYFLTKRKTVGNLVKDFANEVEQGQAEYRLRLESAFETLKGNFMMSKKMDDEFGFDGLSCSTDDDQDETVLVLKDGTPQLACLVNGCSVKSYKLKRHLLNKHHNLTDDTRDFILSMARIIAKNKKSLVPESRRPSRAAYVKNKSNTALVSRKNNMKKCIICSGLFVNMTDHVSNFHKIEKNDRRYDHYVKDSVVVSKVLTKIERGKRVELKEKELEEATQKFKGEMDTQQEILSHLKLLRCDIERVRNDMKTAESKEAYDEIKLKLHALQQEYNAVRYKDTRALQVKTKEWRDCYLAHLQKKLCKFPNRIMNMVLDVILPYEEKKEIGLCFDDLMNGKIIRQILCYFVETENRSCITKIKYIAQFNKFVEFLFLDVDSPERKDDSQIILRSFKYGEVKKEVKNVIESLHKLKGTEIIKSKAKAKKKILTEQELQASLKETKEYLEKIRQEIKDQKHLSYGDKECLNIRNALIAVATVRMGRRTMEMTRMTLNEVASAESTNIDDETYYVINVAQQKNTRSGEPAPVVYDEAEFEVLQTFISALRCKIIDCKFNDIVFPSSSKTNSRADQDLSLPAAFNIMQKYETPSGKKLSSRIVRGSKITASRQKNLSQETLDHMARAMNHSKSTADGYYNYNNLEESVRETLRLNHSSNQPSTSKDIPSVNQVTSTPMKRKRTGDDKSSTLEDLSMSDFGMSSLDTTSDNALSSLHDLTVKNLRTKKIKRHVKDPEAIQCLEKEVKEAIDKIGQEGKLNTLRSKKGLICVSPVTRLIPEHVKNVSVKDLRAMILKMI